MATAAPPGTGTTATDVEDRLQLVEVLGRLPYASNATLLAIDGAGDRWVYKPERGEEPLRDFPWRTLAAREVLAYEVCEAMGLDLVPETVEADGELGPGSAQRFVDEDPRFDPRPFFQPVLSARLWPFAVFDIVANNADRKIGHILCDVDGRLWAIDNGLTFHHHDKLRTVLWGFAGEPIPSPLMAGVEKLQDALDSGLSDRVADLLTGHEAGALASRVETLLAIGAHPMPPENRPPVPWPMW